MLLNHQLLEACAGGESADAVRAIDAGADPNVRDENGRTPLHFALTSGNHTLAHQLVNAGADVNTRFGKRNQTLLHWAAENAAYGACHFLLQYNADINAQRSDGATPLILAARGGHEYVVRLLLKHDAYLSPKTSRNVTARSAAAKHQHSSIVKLIDEAAVTRPGILKDADAAFHSKSGERFLF